MSAPDPEMVRKVAEALASEGCAPGTSIHSWRCEHPDRYGPCDCADDVSRAVLAVAEPLIREQIAQEIEASRATNTFRTTVLERAAKIARGGQ